MRRLWGTMVAVALVAAACTGSSDRDSGATPAAAATAAVATSSTVATGTVVDAAAPAGDSARRSDLVCWTADPAAGSDDIVLADRTEEFGLVEPLVGMHGHAAAWGDPDGDGEPDLVFGTFADRPIETYQVRGGSGPGSDIVLTLGDDTFVTDRGVPAVYGRTSGAVIVDLDDDGDEDIVLVRNMRSRERGDAPTQLYRNDGDAFTLIDLELGAEFSGRSVGVLDYNSDGRLDLFILEDRFGSNDSSVLLENRGELRFADVTAAAGIPAGVHGLGVATSDVTGDGLTDIFVAGSNRMFVADGEGGFVEADSDQFRWEVFGGEDDVSGAAIADLNRDGRPDLVVGHHYNSTLEDGIRVPIRIYLNRGVDDGGLPRFDDVTAASGMPGLPTKAPHVEIADLDNDGWPDILATASAENGSMPAVFRHRGTDAGEVPTFASPDGFGDAQYWVSGPTTDVDQDGRLDLFLVEWQPSLPSLLLVNETESGNWLEVSVGPEADVPAIGTVVEVFAAVAEPRELLGKREIVASQGYAAGNLQVVHFGLGDVDLVDLRITFPGGEVMELPGVAANAHVRVPDGCGG